MDKGQPLLLGDLVDLAALSDEEFERFLRPLWDFLSATENPKVADAIFVFGGVDLHVPDQAADLYKAGFAQVIVVSGNSGLYTANHFSEAEAEVFAARMMLQGVPGEAILKELDATNTGMNVALGMALLQRFLNRSPTRLLIVARSFLTLRGKATFAKQFPEAEIIGCPPDGKILDFVVSTRSRLAARLAAEVDRLDSYATQGFISPTPTPDSIRKISSLLQR